MKKLKQVFNFIIIGAMVLSLMPTIAMAATGSTYTYDFNPAEDTGTVYSTDTHSYDTTVKNAAGESVYAPWAYVGKYNQNTNYPQTNNLKVPNMYTRSQLNGWIALKIRIPESGVYDAELFYTTYRANGGINIYLLPVETELPEDACDFSVSYADYQLNTDVISLYASSTKANQFTEITTKKDITASNDGAEFYLVFQAVKSSQEYGSASDAYYAYLEGLTLTKTAEVSSGDGSGEGETAAPVTLVFNNVTLTNNTNIEDTTFKGDTDTYTAFSIDTANSDTGIARSTALGYRAYLAMGNVYTNWLGSENTKGRLTFTTDAITKAGYYKVNYQAVNTSRPVITYVYINGQYAGVYDAEEVGTETTADVRELNTVYINPAENNGKVDVQLRVAANYGVANTPYMMPAQITLTPVEDDTFSYENVTVECDVPETLEGSATISPVVKLENGEVFDFNNYSIDGTEDTTSTYLTVSVSNSSRLTAEKAVDLTVNAQVLENKTALNMWTLTSVSGGDTTLTISGKINGTPFSKVYAISVPKTDAEYFEDTASYGYGVSYSELNDYVSVGTVAADVVGSAAKGTSFVLKAEKEVTIDGATYKFVGWRRGGTGAVTDALNFTSYVSFSNEDTFTLWANTYLTAVYDKSDDTAEKTVELYNQDGTFLTSATAEKIAELEKIPEVSLLGHTFDKWQYIDNNGETAEFTPETELYETVTRVVAKQIPKTVTITFADGTYGDETVVPTVESGEFDYGEAVSANEFYTMPSDTKVYWSRDGLVTRTQEDYSFYAWADTVLKPEFVTAIPTELRIPKVIVDTKDNNGAYMIEWDVYSNASYTVVEAGILFSNTEDVKLSTFVGEKYTSQRNQIHGQLAAKPNETYSYVRGYVIYKDKTSGDISVVYSEDATVSE